MSEGGLKINRIKSRNKAHMDLLGDVLSPEVLHKRVPRLGEVAEARTEYKNRLNLIQKLGTFGATGFTPSKHMQYVAQIDQSVWSAVLEVFGRHNEAGELIDDGLLYKVDQHGNIQLNRDFFYALLAGPLKDYDMRGKITIV